MVPEKRMAAITVIFPFPRSVSPRRRQVKEMARYRRPPVSKGRMRISEDWRTDRPPAIKEIRSSGSTAQNIMRQPKRLTIYPPMEGPTAGARAHTSMPAPTMTPSRLSGACSIMILNMRGRAMPVPAPWRSRPRRRRRKSGDQAPRSVPRMKSPAAVKKSPFMGNRSFKYPEVGITTASTSRYPVVIHCTREVEIPNSFIREGKVTFIAVSITTPVKDSIPAAMIEKISRLSRRRSNCIQSLPFK